MSQSPLGLSEDLIKRILYLLGALIVFRLGTHIVIPFISQTALASLVEDNRDLDDIMQRIEQMKLEINDLIDDYNIGEENENEN